MCSKRSVFTDVAPSPIGHLAAGLSPSFTKAAGVSSSTLLAEGAIN
jgi:hypothetical protein